METKPWIPSALTVLFIVASLGWIWRARDHARDSLDVEAWAKERLAVIARIEKEHLESGRPPVRPLFIDELLDSGRLDIPVFDDGHGRIEDGILLLNGYCFRVSLTDSLGEPHDEPPVKDVTLNPRFWIAYAWPQEWGDPGRRIFVADSFGSLRSWGHAIPLFVGLAHPPDPWLAKPPSEKSYPFARKTRGWQKHLRWRDESTP